MSKSPVVHVVTQGNLANQMIQFLIAARIASEVENCLISNVNIPVWDIHYAPLPSSDEQDRKVEGHEIDVAGLSADLRSGAVERLVIEGYGQWLGNFPSLADCRAIFPADLGQHDGYGAEYLVCNIRGGEVLDARHPHYNLLPINFYQEILDRTGLHPVFMGQIEDNSYCKALLAAFPAAVFRPSQGALDDFQTFRNSINIVPAISTFSWLAAWLSTNSRITLPVNGLFHPVQCPEIDLLPCNDPRYEFSLFPINFAVPVADFEQALAPINGLWRLMPPERIAMLRLGARFPKRADLFEKFFNEEFYLSLYPDVAGAVARNEVSSGRMHYLLRGLIENRLPFQFDREWYSRAYSLAAFEVGQGDYEDLVHHYVEIGHARGYKPIP